MTESNGLVLGIETSCDDTAVALVDSNGIVVSSAVASQTMIHNRFGGVYPEAASRAHVDKILPTVRMVIEDAGIDPRELEAIGVTRGPGLIGSLMVGVDTAAGLGHGWGVPVIGVNHLRGHLRSADLEERRVTYPAIILLVSGGHTLLARMTSPSDIQLIGNTRDDSVGEAYDKVARMLGLGYPGGPVVDKLALSGQPTIPFPRPMIDQGLEFSFSGLKTAVMYYLAKEKDAPAADIAASFVESCMTVLLAKCRRALEAYPSASLVVVGGVAASPQLRTQTKALCDELEVELCLPPLKWSTDNGAMIGLATWDYLTTGRSAPLAPQTGLTIEQF
ncbi:tRNA (adenosine(37)-N6)-threonylcarbamoyltransferase complex transferase subunit TsaD [Phytohabitans flavus]|uniref:tRNA N6-adenosine threonylcarbamoyltransferase n=1 Tax=Phytohabitans flavus TaxID=1076124 RepID=A0A6F8Y0A8_9ACTN|nr:tRNA (adenosine(37)-N6)-threonylcarbamoyltransferase complex transferase subunit TsaD [Phytohabitans flavus]BCB79497.1 tRNA N6-adenosine threonylcarbamoyltransferase [Phytohabitans flavus]